ncbi:MAG: hypothetical protein D6701_07005, partial [Gemmatimonadetes bacterium]
ENGREAILLADGRSPVGILDLRPAAALSGVTDAFVRRVLPGGRVVLTQQRSVNLLRPSRTPEPAGAILLVDPRRGTVDTLPLGDGRPPAMVVRWRGSSTVQLQPFADQPLTGFDPRGRLAVAVERRTDRAEPSFTVSLLRLSGDTVWRRVVPVDGVELTEARIDAWLAREGPDRSDATPEALEAWRSALYRPAYLPPVTAVVLGEDGGLWLRRELIPGADTVRWEVWSPEGRRSAQVTLPATLRVRAVAADRAWGTQRTEAGRYRIVRVEVGAG